MTTTTTTTPVTTTTMLGEAPLTAGEYAALCAVRDGADIFNRSLAARLRAIERAHPTFLDICPPMGTYGVNDVYPYFGAICTAEGKRALTQYEDAAVSGGDASGATPDEVTADGDTGGDAGGDA